MNARDIIDELSLNTEEITSYLDIFDNVIVELDQKTTNSRDRNKILKILGKLYVVWKGLTNATKSIDKGFNALWDEIIKLEETQN